MIKENVEHVRYQYLDALRGIAAVSVCFHHLFNYIYDKNTMPPGFGEFLKKSVLESFDFGRFGVVLFFLVSGFIIPSSLKPGSTLKKFAITRVFRLYPAFWFACLLIFITAPYFAEQIFSTYQLIANLTMVPKIFRAQEMSGIFWTLFVEILFYFCCAALFKARLLEKPVVIGAIALTLHTITPLAILLNHQFQIDAPVRFLPYHLSFLFMGSIIRLLIVNKDRQARIIAPVLFLYTLISVPLTTGLLFDVPEVVAPGFVLHGAAATTYSYILAIGLFLVVSSTKYGFNRLTVELGKISYSLYLLHMLCFVAVSKLIPATTLATCALNIAVSVVLSFVVAKAAFKFIEEPAIELGRFTAGTRRLKSPA